MDLNRLQKNTDQNCKPASPITSIQTVSFPFGHRPGKYADPAPKRTRYSSCLDQIEGYNTLPVRNQHAIRAMELAKKHKLDIFSIAKELNEPEPWIRKVLLAAIALSLRPGDKTTKASIFETLVGIGFNTSKCTQETLPFHTMLRLVSPDMEQWMKDNFLAKELTLISKLISANKKDMLPLFNGEVPPRKTTRFIELPDAYIDRLEAHTALLEEICDHAKNKRFDRASAKQILVHLNKMVTRTNEFMDVVRENKLL
ncbi:MAG: hypothetical protein Q7U02_08195 [Desulfosalsimonadaceae bacterium]|nr:hypothetical protein [Desulfosalsimonadaceae bacterium]